MVGSGSTIPSGTGSPGSDEAAVARALAAIDALHAEDPRQRRTAAGLRPAEAVWCETVLRHVLALSPQAGPALRIAAAAQHLQRWRHPREDYPSGRAGYLRWRRAAQHAHGEQAQTLCIAAGCPPAVAAAVAALLRKQDPAREPDAAVLEDAACLAFLELDLEDFAARHPEPDVLRILQRTWAKMSPSGRLRAQRSALPEPAVALLDRALGALDAQQ